MSLHSDKKSVIANKIKELRESLKWSQSELARQAGVTGAAISQIEKGGRSPSLMVLRKLAEAFKVKISELTCEEQDSSIIDDAQIFYRRFGAINKLSEKDKAMIESIIKRLKEENE